MLLLIIIGCFVAIDVVVVVSVCSGRIVSSCVRCRCRHGGGLFG